MFLPKGWKDWTPMQANACTAQDDAAVTAANTCHTLQPIIKEVTAANTCHTVATYLQPHDQSRKPGRTSPPHALEQTHLSDHLRLRPKMNMVPISSERARRLQAAISTRACPPLGLAEFRTLRSPPARTASRTDLRPGPGGSAGPPLPSTRSPALDEARLHLKRNLLPESW
jgi:hypothetical protein